MDFELRDYCIHTTLVQNGEPKAVIMSNAQEPGYLQIAADLQAYVQKLTKVVLPIVDATEISAAEALRQSHVIALGNMATNHFIEQLYWEWYTLLDLWYPGRGGYVLRSLHNPHGTRKNVLFLGGSDLQGVADAAEAFQHVLQPGNPCQVGYLADIRLGQGHTLPPAGAWLDPRLRIFHNDGNLPHGYTEASRAGLIYFYNNDEKAAQRFRDLALHSDVLWATDHYQAHMHAIIWDLIEESPFFSSADRVAITKRLLKHAQGPDGSAGISHLIDAAHRQRHDRHLAMQANCTLTVSRYFNKYWPSAEWQANLDAVQTYFDFQMTMCKGNSDLGGRGIYSYLESILFPAILTGDRRLIESGALERYAQLCIMHCDNTGYMPNTGQNSATSYPTYTLMKCAALLNNGELLTVAKLRENAERAAGLNRITEEFTAGQAWATGVKPQPMQQMVGVYHLPLAEWEHRRRGSSIPLAKSFDKLTMRTGFTEHDQYLLLDGIYGGPDSKPWPDANSIAHFTQGGRAFLVSEIGGENPVNHNVISVCKEGLGAQPGRVASLEHKANLPTFGYSHSKVPEHPFSVWDRHIFWRKGSWFVVIDRVAVTEAGSFSIECQWRTLGEPHLHAAGFSSTLWDQSNVNAPRDVFHIKNAEHLPMRYSEQTIGLFSSPDTTAWQAYCPRKGLNRLRQVVNRNMQIGDSQTFTNLFYVGGDRTKACFDIKQLSEHVAVVSGDETAYVGLATPDGFRHHDLFISGAAFCASATTISVCSGQVIKLGATSMEASEPCNMEWYLPSGRLTIENSTPLTLGANDHQYTLPAGTHNIACAAAPRELRVNLSTHLRHDAGLPAHCENTLYPTENQVYAVGNPQWSYIANSLILALCPSKTGDQETQTLAGLADGRVLCLDHAGQLLWECQLPAAVRALAIVPQSNSSFLAAGCDDEHVYALEPSTGRELWRYRCHMPEIIYTWWTTGLKATVRAIAVADIDGDGEPEIICGTGGGCIEAVSCNGQQKWLRQIEWGIPDRIRILPLPDGTLSVLVSNSYSSSGSTVWQLSGSGAVLSRNLYNNLRGDWDMTSVPSLLLTQLQVGGGLYAVVGRKNAYNEVALHNAITGERKWIHLMGDWVSAVEVCDINGDGTKEVLVGTPAAWLCAFDIEGRKLWARQTPHEVIAMKCFDDKLWVACNDKSVYETDLDGIVKKRYALQGEPHWSMLDNGTQLIIGDNSGAIYCLTAL